MKYCLIIAYGNLIVLMKINNVNELSDAVVFDRVVFVIIMPKMSTSFIGSSNRSPR